MSTKPAMSIQDIMGHLPHRYPFLLIDRVLETRGFDWALGIKQLTHNEYYFQGHFPGAPEMPTSILLEAMAQLGAAVTLSNPEAQGKYILFGSLDQAEFGRPAVPGECLYIEAQMLGTRRGMGKTRITARVENEEQIATAVFMFALVDNVDGG